MSGLARPPKQTGGQKRNVRFVGPGMLSPAGGHHLRSIRDFSGSMLLYHHQ